MLSKYLSSLRSGWLQNWLTNKLVSALTGNLTGKLANKLISGLTGKLTNWMYAHLETAEAISLLLENPTRLRCSGFICRPPLPRQSSRWLEELGLCGRWLW